MIYLVLGCWQVVVADGAGTWDWIRGRCPVGVSIIRSRRALDGSCAGGGGGVDSVGGTLRGNHWRLCRCNWGLGIYCRLRRRNVVAFCCCRVHRLSCTGAMVRNKICVYLSGLLRHGLLCRRWCRHGSIVDCLGKPDGAKRLLGAQETIQQVELLSQNVRDELRVHGGNSCSRLIARYMQKLHLIIPRIIQTCCLHLTLTTAHRCEDLKDEWLRLSSH